MVEDVLQRYPELERLFLDLGLARSDEAGSLIPPKAVLHQGGLRSIKLRPSLGLDVCIHPFLEASEADEPKDTQNQQHQEDERSQEQGCPQGSAPVRIKEDHRWKAADLASFVSTACILLTRALHIAAPAVARVRNGTFRTEAAPSIAVKLLVAFSAQACSKKNIPKCCPGG